MFLPGVPEYHNIIKVGCCTGLHACQHLVHHPLEHHRGTIEPKGGTVNWKCQKVFWKLWSLYSLGWVGPASSPHVKGAAWTSTGQSFPPDHQFSAWDTSPAYWQHSPSWNPNKTSGFHLSEKWLMPNSTVPLAPSLALVAGALGPTGWQMGLRSIRVMWWWMTSVWPGVSPTSIRILRSSFLFSSSMWSKSNCASPCGPGWYCSTCSFSSLTALMDREYTLLKVELLDKGGIFLSMLIWKVCNGCIRLGISFHPSPCLPEHTWV